LKQKGLLIACIVLAVLIIAAAVFFAFFRPAAERETKARVILMPIIKDTEAQLIAIQRGDIHIYPGLVRAADINALKDQENIEITMDLGFHFFYVGINMRRDPLNAKVLRQAIAHMVNREEIINSLFEGYMLPLAHFVPPSSPYHDDTAPVFAYDPERAQAILDEAGYVLDEATGIRINPATGKPLREMIFMTPTYEVAPTSAELGKIIAEAAQSIGIPIKNEPLDFPVMLDRLDMHDFDLYALAWSLGRIPTFLYDFFHSSQDVEGGYNYPGIRNPELDELLEGIYYAPDEETAREYASKAQQILAEELPYIPLYSRPYMDAFRTDKVTGYVPMLGYGAAQYRNNWTKIGIRPLEGEEIRWLLPEEPQSLNFLTNNSAYAAEVFFRAMEPLIEVDPETLENVPWLATEWKVETWEPEPGREATKLIFKLRKGVKWHDGHEFTAEDVAFAIKFIKDNKIPLYYSDVQDVVRTNVPDPYTLEVYFDKISYWYLIKISDLPQIPKHIYEKVDDYQQFQCWLEPHPEVEGLTQLIGTGPYVFDEYVPGEYVRLVRFEDYWYDKK